MGGRCPFQKFSYSLDLPRYQRDPFVHYQYGADLNVAVTARTIFSAKIHRTILNVLQTGKVGSIVSGKGLLPERNSSLMNNLRKVLVASFPFSPPLFDV